MKTLIINGKVITPYEIKSNTNILIEDGKFAEITCKEETIKNKDINVIDAKGKFQPQRTRNFGAALSDDRVSCDLICDGIHLYKAGG